MRPTLKLRPIHWVAIDLLALLIIIGWAMATYALDTDIWRPMGPVTPTFWPLLAFPVALAIVCGFALLLAWQLSATGLIGKDGAHPSSPPHGHALLVREPLPVSVVGSRQPIADLQSQSEEPMRETEVTERVLVSGQV
jgi:hypothetical protein